MRLQRWCPDLGVSACAAGHNFVGTEQILLGLIGESTGIAAKVLKSMGVNLKETRVEVEKIIGRGSGFVAVEIPFTPRAKRVLELSLEEARQLGEALSSALHTVLFALSGMPQMHLVFFGPAALFARALWSTARCIAGQAVMHKGAKRRSVPFRLRLTSHPC